MTKFLKLTEVTKEGANVKTMPVLINPAFVLGVSHGELVQPGPHIIGQTKSETVSLIQLSAGRPVFVEESIEEILAAVEALE